MLHQQTLDKLYTMKLDGMAGFPSAPRAVQRISASFRVSACPPSFALSRYR